jgi:hypothetical protein
MPEKMLVQRLDLKGAFDNLQRQWSLEKICEPALHRRHEWSSRKHEYLSRKIS